VTFAPAPATIAVMYRLAFFLLLAVVSASAGCGGAQDPALQDASRVGGQDSQQGDDDGRWHHFWIIRQAVDAVMHGNDKATRILLQRIADGNLGEEVPSEWTFWVEEMQDEALAAERTRGLKPAAEIVTAIASRCGECHRSLRNGPAKLGLERLEQLAHGSSGADPSTSSHRWAADELWLGMTIPQHQAWVRGTRALTDSPLHVPPGQLDPDAPDAPEAPHEVAGTRAPAGNAVAVQLPERDPKLSRGLQELVGVGERLLETGHPLPMAKAYADYISRCGGCHTGG